MMYNEPTQYHRKIEPTQLAYHNPYEETSPYHGVPDIPPPPPRSRQRRSVWIVIVGVTSIIVLIAVLTTVLAGVISAKNETKQERQSAATPPTATHVSKPTLTPTSQPTILVETPTPALATPVPVINTAQDIYTQFTDANIAMGNAGDVEHSWWLQCCSYYPGKGSISFVDEASSGTMIIALFNSANGLQTDVSQLASRSNHPGDYYLGNCLLLYWNANTNLTPYEQVIQQYC